MAAGRATMDALGELARRGLLKDVTDGTAEHLGGGSRVCYAGFDPTAASLHVGHLLPIMGLVQVQRLGHHPVALVGGGTGLIGDPSGRTAERALLTREQVREHARTIRVQLEHFLDFDVSANPARVRDNLDWLDEIGLVGFLRDTGKHFSINAMMRKESVRRRLEDEEAGISYTEFSYLLLQAYDFLELHRREGCTVQLGGSDQWGNITAGIDLIRRATGADAFGFTVPLLTTASGTKFGKTEAGAVWLDPEQTSPYRFYQFWINVEDDDVISYLRAITLLSSEEISELAGATRVEPSGGRRSAISPKTLPGASTGRTALRGARRATDALFGGELEGLGATDIEEVFTDVPSSEVSRDDLSGDGMPLVQLLADAGVTTSRGDARRSIEGGGVYMNNRRVVDVDARVRADQAIEGRFLVLRKGKKRYHLTRVTG